MVNKVNIHDGSGQDWLEVLEGEDLVFIKRFVLASGSLKKVAAEYGVSYPTIRSRLDRVIAKIEVSDHHRNAPPFERLLRSQYVEGKFDYETLKALLDAFRNEKETPE